MFFEVEKVSKEVEGRKSVDSKTLILWSQWRDSNPRPSVYETRDAGFTLGLPFFSSVDEQGTADSIPGPRPNCLAIRYREYPRKIVNHPERSWSIIVSSRNDCMSFTGALR